MHKLEHKAYSAAHSVLNTLAAQHVAVAAVLDGALEGDIWVNDRLDPTIALMTNGETYYLAGSPELASQTCLAALGREIPAWAYLFAEDRWVGHLARFWSNPFARPHPRVRFGLADYGLPPSAVLPDGFNLVRVDQALLDAAPENLATVTDVIDGWPSTEAFLESGIGFCVLHQGRIVSHCASDSVTGMRCELGVGTEPGYRRLGLAKMAATAALSECLDRGIVGVEWHSHASNRGSIAIAKAIGLVENDRHFAYSGNLPAENVGDLDPETCKDWAFHLEGASSQIGWYRFHAAGAWALLGERERALANISLLVDGGWDGEAEWLEGYWAVASLVDDPQFQALVSRQRQAQAD